MMGSRVRVTQAAPNFLRKIKSLGIALRGGRLETSLSVKPLSPHCLQERADCRIRMASCGSVLGLDTPRQSRFGVGGSGRLEYGLAAEDGGRWRRWSVPVAAADLESAVLLDLSVRVPTQHHLLQTTNLGGRSSNSLRARHS